MSDNVKSIMNELDGILDLIQAKKTVYRQSNMKFNCIEDIEVLMSCVEGDFKGLESRFLEFRDNLNDVLLKTIQDS